MIARASSFAYKGRSVDVRQVGRELGVRYVLQGSIRKSGSRIRVTVQLLEATTGSHVWSDRYDDALDDIFDLQDRIAESVHQEPPLAINRPILRPLGRGLWPGQ